MLYLAILLLGIVLIIIGKDSYYNFDSDSIFHPLFLGKSLIVIVIIAYILTVAFTFSLPVRLKALQMSLKTQRNYMYRSVENSEYLFKSQDYWDTLYAYNNTVLFWRRYPHFDTWIWLFPQIGARITQLEIIPP